MTGSKSQLDLAWSALEQRQYAEALRLARLVLEHAPDNVSALACEAMANWMAGGDIALSLSRIVRAVELAPEIAAVRHNYATLLASNGEVGEAAEQFREALRIRPDDTLAFYGLTQNFKFREFSDVIAQMEALHESRTLEASRREFLSFGLAKVFDDLDQPERAFAYAREANDLVRRPFDAARESAALKELRELAGVDAFRSAPRSGHPSRAPLFIVGMNRSGTTLVESILSRHPDVLARGERSEMVQIEMRGHQKLGEAARGFGRHRVALALERDWLKVQAEEIVKHAAGRPFPVMTDKLPENALRLGLIARLFPQARVIYLRRHPLDVGVSNYFQRFQTGQGYSFRLDWIGMRTRQIADAMAIWKQALDLPILDVSYEKLVAEPEAQSRRIVAFAGLEWNDACLEPQRTARGVMTSSQWQVRQPINTGSVDRWTRYEPWLGPMIEAMGGMDWIEREVAEIRSVGQGSVASRSNSSSKNPSSSPERR